MRVVALIPFWSSYKPLKESLTCRPLVEVSGKSFSWYFQEIIGIKHLTLGDTKKANSIFTSLSLDKDTPFDLKIRLDKLIQIAN